MHSRTTFPWRLALILLFTSVLACGKFDTKKVFLSSAHTPEVGQPVSVIDEGASGITIEVKVAEYDLSDVEIAGKFFNKLLLNDFKAQSLAGDPLVPSRQELIYVPIGREINLAIIEKGAEIELPIDHDFAFETGESFHKPRSAFAKQNMKSYQQTYGEKLAEISEVSFAGRDRLAEVKLYPVRYDAAARRAFLTKNFKVHFSFTRTKALSAVKAPVSESSVGLAKYVALNGHRAAVARSVDPLVELVIAHASHQPTLVRYVEFKKSLGFEVREHYVSDKASAQIKEIITAEHNAAVPPTSTLLVGNIDQIPAWRGSNDNSWTDYNYQLLDQGSIPDISVGRVPAHNADELNAFLDKAIAREVDSRNIDDILLTAGRDVSLGCPQNVTRVGEKFRPAGPNINLIKKYRSENVSTQEVYDAYNASPNIIVYDGHGNRQGMSEIPLNISNLPQLTNTSFPIILDIACLNANWGQGANARNFAESILLQNGAGVAGIMASGGSGYGHDFFQSIAEFMATGRLELPEDPDTLLNQIGHVILLAKIRHGSQDRSYWNYYGDPATSVWEAN